MKNIVEEFELEFDGFSGFSAIHKNDVEKIQHNIAALCAENAKLREVLGIAHELLTCAEIENLRLRGYTADVRKMEAALNSTTPNPLYLAAPEMLEALEKTLRWMRTMAFQAESSNEIGEAIAQTIARAKGESA